MIIPEIISHFSTSYISKNIFFKFSRTSLNYYCDKVSLINISRSWHKIRCVLTKCESEKLTDRMIVKIKISR